MTLFVILGLEKLTGFDHTVTLFMHMGVPMPGAATVVAILVELGIGQTLLVGLFTRPLAVLMGVYVLATALIGRHYWDMTGPERFEAEIDFYKNVAIMGGLFLLYLPGAGRHSLDYRIRAV